MNGHVALNVGVDRSREQVPMEGSTRLEEICRAMEDPAFYPHPVSRIEFKETHISAVFLTGTWVYKMKKPVDFGFLDFTTIEKRLEFCRREVLLNQRLSHGVYEGVVSICRGKDGRLRLGDSGDVVEYAVRMRQLPEETNLAVLIEKRMVSPTDMTALGDRLARFYRAGSCSPEIDRFGDPEVISFNMEENFRQVEPFVGSLVDEEWWEFIRQASRAFFQYRLEFFQKRISACRIRDGHGDLRVEHVYFSDGIQIIDCIEFNDRFRFGDVAIDLAFLHMDMERLGHSELSRMVLESCVKQSGDGGLYELLDFYAAYRAVVALKVACLRSTEVEDPVTIAELHGKVREYLHHAYRYALQFSRPALWVFCGLPATGKSALALEAAQTLDIALFQSDRIRKESAGKPPETTVVAYGKGLYRRELRRRVYAELLARAQEQLKRGRSAILDATFSSRKWREEAARLARDCDASLLLVECVCSEETIRKRLMHRETEKGLSDARLRHLDDMIAEFEPVTGISPECHLRIDTDSDFVDAFTSMLSRSYASRRMQVQILMERL